MKLRPTIAELVRQTRELGVHVADDVLAGIEASDPEGETALVQAWVAALGTAKERSRKSCPSSD